ncbi:BTB/POZ domain-containing protein [Aspergillus lucknowensis]|uniref:BTB domain-containing protein n=1 Tax=Aspergillus lucknowensis TaxID=176173 RepID=A0ABR4LWD8_9EURO
MLATRRNPQSHSDSFSSRYGTSKATSRSRRYARDTSAVSKRLERRQVPDSPPDGSSPSSAVITISVGPERRLFAAHKEILCVSPFFATACSRAQTLDALNGRRIALPEEQPEVFSCILEYLYRGDYYPRLARNERRDTWELEAPTTKDGYTDGATIFSPSAGGEILKDTAVYCAADKYGLEHLKRLSLMKQGLHTGIQCMTILASARYAYANTPDHESKLRAHYLALIIRSRSTFKRSGTMQMEMERGGKLFFDLFVAMCNHMDDLVMSNTKPTLLE